MSGSKEEWWKRSLASRARAPSKLPGFVPSVAEGVYVTDVDGRRYLDFSAQSFNIGHNHPRLLNAMEQITAGKRNLEIYPLVVLAEKLKDLAPLGCPDVRVGFTRGGTLAAEHSILTVKRYSEKSAIIACQGSYHGGALASLSLTMDQSELKKGLYPLLPDVVHVPYAYCYRCPHGLEYPSCRFQCVEYVRQVLDTVVYPKEVAAFFIEPIQVHGGLVVPPDGYFEKIRKICDEHEILLVDDEIVTGLGRTGNMFGIRHWDVRPDLIFMGKPLGSILPLGAVMARSEIMKAFRGEGEYPISCAVALATIEVILEERLTENASRMGDYMIKRLRELQVEHEIIGDIRGKGLLMGMELVKDRRRKTPGTKEAGDVLIRAFQNGLLMLIGGTYKQTFRFTPPLTITREQIDEGVDILKRTFKDLDL